MLQDTPEVLVLLGGKLRLDIWRHMILVKNKWVSLPAAEVALLRRLGGSPRPITKHHLRAAYASFRHKKPETVSDGLVASQLNRLGNSLEGAGSDIVIKSGNPKGQVVYWLE
jgi:hypothetical protein